MSNFNSVEFGSNIKLARNSKGYSQENLAKALGVNRSTIARYESGEILPNAEQIAMICEELDIYEYDLFKSEGRQLINKETSKNPFDSNVLYMFYQSYYPSKDIYKVGKYKLIIKEKPDMCLVDFVDYKTGKIYSTGTLQSDDNIAVIVLENYKPSSPRLEVSETILNIANGTDGEILGTFTCTNGQYVPSIRKCIVTFEDKDIDDSIKEKLKITPQEIEQLKKLDILYLSTRKKEDYEDL